MDPKLDCEYHAGRLGTVLDVFLRLSAGATCRTKGARRKIGQAQQINHVLDWLDLYGCHCPNALARKIEKLLAKNRVLDAKLLAVRMLMNPVSVPKVA